MSGFLFCSWVSALLMYVWFLLHSPKCLNVTTSKQQPLQNLERTMLFVWKLFSVLMVSTTSWFFGFLSQNSCCWFCCCFVVSEDNSCSSPIKVHPRILSFSACLDSESRTLIKTSWSIISCSWDIKEYARDRLKTHRVFHYLSPTHFPFSQWKNWMGWVFVGSRIFTYPETFIQAFIDNNRWWCNLFRILKGLQKFTFACMWQIRNDFRVVYLHRVSSAEFLQRFE